ncbi:MAG: MaoC family dehydratase [Gammaproteobacteria bacterium]
MATVLKGVEGLRAHVGTHLGYSDYATVTQQRIDQFAEATGDRQWIHVDIERAKTGPYGRTIAHGLLTLSMIGDLAKGLFSFDGFRMGLNYGYDKVRFPTPVPVDSRVRLGAKVARCEMINDGVVQTVIELTVEIEGRDKPACVADMIFRHYLS